jgi:hypothetical protein
MSLVQEKRVVDEISDILPSIKMLDEVLANGTIDEEFHRHWTDTLLSMHTQQFVNKYPELEKYVEEVPDEGRHAYIAKMLDEKRERDGDKPKDAGVSALPD